MILSPGGRRAGPPSREIVEMTVAAALRGRGSRLCGCSPVA
jgi:hypothetical protein